MNRLFSILIMIMGLSLEAFSQGDGPMTAYSMVTKDGRRLVSYKGADGKDVFELVPLSELPEGLPEVRPWKIFSIKSSHRRYYYRIRPVFKNGMKGAFSEVFSAITRQMIP